MRRYSQRKMFFYQTGNNMPKKTPKVSIIIPCYNVADCMESMFKSLYNQTFKDIEIICVDDKSTDDTVKKLKQFKKRDKRIVLLELDENHGVGFARNTGLRKALGQFVCFFDPDDYVDDNFIEVLYNIITKKHLDAVKGAFNAGSSNIKRNKLINKNPLEFCSEHMSALYKRKFLLDNNILYPEDVRTSQDVVFLSNLVLHTKKIYAVSDVNYYYVRRPNSLDSETLSHDKVLARLRMLQYKIEMLKEHSFDNKKDKGIFVCKHILEHFNYAFERPKANSDDNKLLFNWLVSNMLYLRSWFPNYYDSVKIKAIANNDFDNFIKKHRPFKLFYKERSDNGNRKIYILGLCIFVYNKHNKFYK